ncbi:MAG: SH3 domain-containing protein [Pseudomonas sp.]|uniref:SH3 domain-containing protein n=1 Tax=Pseudomonas sp. TaxID=306 RepID=UPI002FC8D112
MSRPEFDQREERSVTSTSAGVIGAAAAFAVKNQWWISKAAKSGALGYWRDQELRLLEEMAWPEGIEQYALLLDKALAHWPSSPKLPSVSLTKVSAFLASSSLFDSRVEQLIQAMPDAFAGADSGQLKAIAGFDVTLEVQKKAEREISQQIRQGAAASDLSSLARQYLAWLWLLVTILMNYLALQNGVRGELCFVVPKVLPAMTSNNYGKAVRAAMCEAAIPAEEFARYRIVKGESVHLRTEPGGKSALVSLSLKNMDLLEVLDDSNRDWLLVAVVNEDGVTGWVSRKYTHRLSR